MPLDRNSVPRESDEWVRHHLESDNARFLILYDDANLTHWQSKASTPEGIYLTRSEASQIIVQPQEVIYLGHLGTNPIFAIDLTGTEKDKVEGVIGQVQPRSEFIDLRLIGMLLAPSDAAIFAYARGICYWHRHHLFCSRCGNGTQSRRGGHMRKCKNSSCNRETYPRIDPAVIMLVELRESANGPPRCLLGRHAGLPKGIYSTLAGYVDPGETLEETVIREVKEESGIPVSDVQYVASQPWPFPSSMMLGFRAKALDFNIDISKDELEDAQWFTAQQILEFGEYGESQSKPALPRRDSIAYTLIQSWLKDKT